MPAKISQAEQKCTCTICSLRKCPYILSAQLKSVRLKTRLTCRIICHLLFSSVVMLQYSPPNHSNFLRNIFAACFVAASTLLFESKIEPSVLMISGVFAISALPMTWSASRRNMKAPALNASFGAGYPGILLDGPRKYTLKTKGIPQTIP